MRFVDPPPIAAWQHHDARTGFEVTTITPRPDGYVLTGTTAAVEDDTVWSVEYEIVLDAGWTTRTARVSSLSGPVGST